jgi:putative transcriptional regulator
MKRVNLKKARLERNLKQGELATILGIHIDHLRSLEYGRVNPSSPLLIKICKYFNEEPETLFPDIAV